jgi:m7GpppX diphosphatase
LFLITIMSEINNFNNIQNIKFINYSVNASVFTGIYQGKDIIFTIKTKPIKNAQFLENKQLQQIFHNDRFTKYIVPLETECEILTVYPSLEDDFYKYTVNKQKVIETPEMYQKLYPKITKQDLSWIDNIIEGKTETENILYSDEDFIFLPDLKWDRKDMQSLYYLAIVKNKSLKSIRDLNQTHLPLLKKIRSIALELLDQKFSISGDQLRIYFHYHPSYWQLHIHFNLITKIWTGAIIDFSHSLHDVISNIEIVPNYYQIVNLEIMSMSHQSLIEHKCK